MEKSTYKIILILFILGWYLSSCSGPEGDCYNVGFKQGSCLALEELGLAKEDCDSINVPTGCEREYIEQFNQGLEDGKESVYSSHSD